jgi:hypothetical protein
MSRVKRFIQKSQPANEIITKGKGLASAKDQFTEAREVAQIEADGNAN